MTQYISWIPEIVPPLIKTILLHQIIQIIINTEIVLSNINIKRCSEQTLETLKSTSNDDKEKKANITYFKVEQCENKLSNMCNLLCIYEKEKKNRNFIDYTLYLVAIEKYLKDHVEYIRYIIVTNGN